jgi:hypothetical protein
MGPAQRLGAAGRPSVNGSYWADRAVRLMRNVRRKLELDLLCTASLHRWRVLAATAHSRRTLVRRSPGRHGCAVPRAGMGAPFRGQASCVARD